MKYSDFRGRCPTCKINLTSDDMPFGDACPYCKGPLPTKSIFEIKTEDEPNE